MSNDHERGIEAARNAFKKGCGIQIYLPSEGTLDDMEQERYDALVAAISAYLSALAPQAGDNAEEPVAWTTQAQLDGIKGTGNNAVMWGEPLPHHPDIPLYTHPVDGQRDKGMDVERLTRPIIGIENRTALEAFDIMADRIRSAIASPQEGQG